MSSPHLKSVLCGVSAAISLLLGPTSARAYTGNDLWTACTTQAPLGHAICLAYIRGVLDGVVAAEPLFEERSRILAPCLRPNVTMDQVVDVVVASLRANPSTRDRDGGQLVYLALVQGFPCRAIGVPVD